MENQRTCSQCSAQLTPEILCGHCPACLLKLGLREPEDDAISLKNGDRIGRYRLLGKIGEGGCGIVFRAEQEEPVRRQVAFKIVKLGMDTQPLIARFEAERQVLANLSHPHIAKIFDAETTDTGRPFFVMELVQGQQITRYCDAHKLGIRERVELFVLVCLAVQHAHQKGIIHRDLKPSNILVVEGEHGTKATPKIIDFGIAKTSDRDWNDNSTAHPFIGTPAYMSPEQAGLGEDVDTRSDIYSLGVLLYELLTGVTPLDPAELRHNRADEISAIIREKESLKPSIRLASLDWAQLAAAAKNRGMSTAALPRFMRAELDWIVMRCLEKERGLRYETSFGLAQDLQRWLAHEPISARPTQVRYRIRKMVRRNRPAFATALAVLIAIVIATGFSAWSRAEERKARRVAALADQHQRQSIERSELLAQGLSGQKGKVFEVVRVFEAILANAATAAEDEADSTAFHEFLDQAFLEVNHDLKKQPEVKAELLNSLAESYRRLGDYDMMERMARAGIEVCKDLPKSGAIRLRLQEKLGDALLHEKKFSEAEPEIKLALIQRKKIGSDQRAGAALTLHSLGTAQLGEQKFADAETTERQAIALAQRLFRPKDLRIVSMKAALTKAVQAQGKVEEPTALAEQSESNDKRETLEIIPAISDISGAMNVRERDDR